MATCNIKSVYRKNAHEFWDSEITALSSSDFAQDEALEMTAEVAVEILRRVTFIASMRDTDVAYTGGLVVN